MPCPSPGPGCIPGRTADAILDLNLATDFDDFREAARSFAVPAQNLLYADREGHIGYQAPGQVPMRRPALPRAPAGYWPAPGWDSTYDWQGFVEFSEMPWALDPEGRRDRRRRTRPCTSSRRRSSRASGTTGGARPASASASRPWTRSSPADMADIQLDTEDSFAKVLVPALLAVPLSASEADPDSAELLEFTREARELLRDWDFTTPAGDAESGAAAAYYNAVWRNLLELLFDDELPTGLKADGDARWRSAVQRLLANPKSAWWDNKLTPNVTEGKDEMLRQALVEARLELDPRARQGPRRSGSGASCTGSPSSTRCSAATRCPGRCAGWSTRARTTCRVAPRSSTPTAGTRARATRSTGRRRCGWSSTCPTSTARRGSTRPG